MILENIRDMAVEAADKEIVKINIPRNLSDLTDDLNIATIIDLNQKVDKIEGKGLSTNDFTNELSSKLNGFYYNTYNINNMINELFENDIWNNYDDPEEEEEGYFDDFTSEDIISRFGSIEIVIADYMINIVSPDIHLAVLFIEVDSDLKPYLYMYYNKSDSLSPTSNDVSVFDLTKAEASGIIGDLSDYIQKSNTSGLVKNDGTIDTNQYVATSQLNHSNKNVIVNSNGEIDFEDIPIHPNYGYIDDNFNLNLLYLQIFSFSYDELALEGEDNLDVIIKDESRNPLEGIYVDFFKQYEDGAEEQLIETVITGSNGMASSMYEDDGSQFLIARVSDTIESKIQIRDDS